ncbi:MAG: hypothetical protein U1E14_06635 [Geminicoccaceae bacterium]
MATAAAPEAQTLRRHSALSDMLAAGLPLAAASLACGLAFAAATKLADEAGFRAAQAGAKWLQALTPAQFAKMGRKLVRGVVVRALAEDKVSIVGLLLRQTKILEPPEVDRQAKKQGVDGFVALVRGMSVEQFLDFQACGFGPRAGEAKATLARLAAVRAERAGRPRPVPQPAGPDEHPLRAERPWLRLVPEDPPPHPDDDDTALLDPDDDIGRAIHGRIHGKRIETLPPQRFDLPGPTYDGLPEGPLPEWIGRQPDPEDDDDRLPPLPG